MELARLPRNSEHAARPHSASKSPNIARATPFATADERLPGFSRLFTSGTAVKSETIECGRDDGPYCGSGRHTRPEMDMLFFVLPAPSPIAKPHAEQPTRFDHGNQTDRTS